MGKCNKNDFKPRKRALGGELNHHWTRKGSVMLPKKQFTSIEDCYLFMNENNISQKVYVPYVCSDCGYWHIGHRRIV